MNASRLATVLALLVAITAPALAAGFNTSGTGLVVSYDGTITGSSSPGGVVGFLQAGIYDPNTGLPASGGLVYFYAPNTTTAKDVYADPLLSTVANNPVVLNAAGVATVYAYGTYKVVVTNSSGTRIATYAALNYPDNTTGSNVADYLVLDPTDDGLATRIETDQTALSMSAVYALNRTTSALLPIKFGAHSTSSVGLFITNAGTRVGVNNAAPTVALDVTGDAKASGSIIAASLAATGAVSGASASFTGAVGAASVAATGAVSGASVSATGAVSGATGSFSGAVGAASVTATGAVGGSSLSATANNASITINDTDGSGGNTLTSQAYDAGTGVYVPFNALSFSHNISASTGSVSILRSPAGGTDKQLFRVNDSGAVSIANIETVLGPDRDPAGSAGAQLYVGGKTTLVGDGTNPALEVHDGGTPALSVIGDGSVVVGNPSSALTLSNGFIVWKPGLSRIYDSDTGTGVLFTSFALASAIYAHEISSGNLNNLRFGSASANVGLFWKTSEASIGINDDTPSAELDVNGDAAVSTLAIRVPGTGVGTMLGIDPASTSKEVILLTSSKRFKTDIKDAEFAWAEFNSLRPVTYRPRSNPTGIEQNGLIAEDVEPLFPGVVQLDEDGNPFSIDYGRLVSPTIAAVQALKRENDELRARLDRLEKIAEALK